jgi:cysteinyl-tRNA synthetase
VSKFDAVKNHQYAKLVPEAFGDTAQLQEGEGDLSGDKGSEKRSPNDFALWKNSKAGEPAWSSPWGEGRPGWHIECSAMAAEIFKSDLDIHTGGVDLKFPHHDNEIAQSEAYYDEGGWVKYFLHTGHLTISGCKMSKSLKNFVTIKEALKQHTATQIRFAFLLHSWKDTLDYSANTMEIAIRFEKLLNEFFLTVKDLLRQRKSDEMLKFTAKDLDLSGKFLEARKAVHAALCDNIDTKSALDAIRELISHSNIYIRDNQTGVNVQLLEDVAIYITELLQVFGAIQTPKKSIGFPAISGGNGVGNKEEVLMPYLSALADFRMAVRESAREVKATAILQLCDELRDEILPNLSVRLEDREGQSVVKLVDRDILIKEREEKKRREEQKKVEQLAKLELQRQKEKEKLEQMKVNPVDMFKSQTDKYSAFDDTGLPTLDNEGKEVSKGQQKKLKKLQQQQETKYAEYLKSLEK